MFLFTLFSVVHVIVCIFLVVVILMQAAKGHGLAGAFGSFGGGMTQNLFGAQAGDVLTKATTIAAITFVCTSLTLAILSAKRSASIMTDVKKEAVTEEKADKPIEEKSVEQKAPDIQKDIEKSAEQVQDVQKNIEQQVQETANEVEEKPAIPSE